MACPSPRRKFTWIVVEHRHRSEKTAEERKRLMKEFARSPAQEGVNGDLDVANEGSQADSGQDQCSNKKGKELGGDKKQGKGKAQIEGEEQNNSMEDTKEDHDPPKLADPTVWGKVIWLRPANKASIMYGAVDLRREGLKPSKEEERRIQRDLSEDELRQKESDDQVFDPRVIPADAVTMCTLLLATQSLEDHCMDQYRTGLGMPTRTIISQYSCERED
jgi:hypothetical protein